MLDGAANKPPIPLRWVWGLCAIGGSVILITAFAAGGVTRVTKGSVDSNEQCTFNHSVVNGIILDLLCLQLPLVSAISLSSYLYVVSVRALKNSPASVVERQLKRALGYIGVMLLVWVPNILYNFATIKNRSNTSHHVGLDTVVILVASQVRSSSQIAYMREKLMKQCFLDCVGFCRLLLHLFVTGF